MPLRRRLHAIVLGACVVVATGGAASTAPAQTAGPSVRAAGPDLRFRDPGVTRPTRTVRGDLVEVAHGRRRYVVETTGGRSVPVDFGGVELPERARGAELEAETTPAGDVRSATISPEPRAAAVTPKRHRAYVALVGNKGDFSSTDQEIRATLEQAMQRWVEESNGAISSFEVAGFQRYDTSTSCDSGSELYNEAAERVYPRVSTSTTSGDHVITISPKPACGAGGVGYLQSSINSGGRLNAGWDPRSTLQTLMHELGHNFSLDHANACYQPVGTGCSVQEYANTYAIMGYTLSNTPAYVPAALDSFERTRLGITDPGEVAQVALPAGQRTTSGTYDLRARGTTSGQRGVRITDPVTKRRYSVDWRSGGSRDASSGYALDPVKDNYGVTVERIADDGETAAVLGHPGYAQPTPVRFGLTAGMTFTDGGTSIAVASTGDRNDPGAVARIGVTLTDPSVADPPAATTPAPSTTPAPVAPTTPGSPVPPATNVPPGAGERRSAPLEPAKLEVQRASVSRGSRRLSLVAPITRRASGDVRVSLRAAGRTTTFDAPIDADRREVRASRRIPAAQARAGSGILTLAYRGDADTQPQTVRVRAASRAPGLRAGRPRLGAGRLTASGRLSTRARGVVRVQLLYEPESGPTRTLTYRARIARGRYRLSASVPADVRGTIEGRRGVLHSYTLFTGDLGRGIRGELASFQVLGAPAPR